MRPKSKNIDYSKYFKGTSFTSFYKACRAKSTKYNYKYYLYKLCEELNLTTEDIVRLYAVNESTAKPINCIKLENGIRDLIEKDTEGTDQEKPDPVAHKVKLLINAIKRFCDVNRINLQWGWIKQFIPETNNNSKDEAYTIDDIRSMLNASDVRSRVMLLLFASTAMRSEALCKLRVKDLNPMKDKNGELDGGSVCIYRGTPQEDVIYCTPEAYKAYLEYLKVRRNFNEVITPESPVILRRLSDEYYDTDETWTENQTISPSNMSSIMVNLAKRAKVRELSKDYDHRYTKKIIHGIRKYVQTILLHAKYDNGSKKLDAYTADRLLSHSRRGGIPLTKIYDKATIVEWFEEYKKVIPDLTISEEEKYKVKYQNAKVQLDSTKKVENYLGQKDKELAELTRRLSQMEQERKEEKVRNNRLLSLLAKEAMEGKPMIPKSWLDLIYSGQFDSIPLLVSDPHGKDVKEFFINRNLDSIKKSYSKESKKFKKLTKSASSGKAKLHNLQDPPTAFRIKKKG